MRLPSGKEEEESHGYNPKSSYSSPLLPLQARTSRLLPLRVPPWFRGIEMIELLGTERPEGLNIHDNCHLCSCFWAWSNDAGFNKNKHSIT